MSVASSDHLRVRADGEVTAITLLAEDLDETTATTAGEELLRLVEGQARPRLRLDFGRVERLTSTALGKLVALHRQVRAAGGELTVENVRPFPYEVFEVTRLTGVLRIHPETSPGPAAG